MTYEERRNELIARYKKLRDQGAEDIKFNRGDLNAAFDSTEKSMKWLGIRSQWLQLHRSFEFNRMQAWKKAYEYYKTDYPFTLNSKDEYKNLISIDPAYSEVADLATLTSDIVDYIDATIDQLKTRHFEIKTYLEYLKFTNGQ